MKEKTIQAYGRQFQISEEDKEKIDNMTQYQMGKELRFSPVGNPMMCGDLGEYFMMRFKELGGMTTEISKSLGW